MRKVLYPKLLSELAHHGHSRKWLAKQLNLSDSSMYHRLLGDTQFKLDELRIIAKIYNKTISELFEGD